MSAKAAIFDVDGTLVDSVDAHAKAWDETFRHFGLQFPYEKVRHGIGKGSDQYLQTFLPREEAERRHDAFIKFRLELFKKKYLPTITPFPCVRELFEHIKKAGLKIALASSAKKDEQDAYLKLINVDDLIDSRTTADDADRSKPHPDIFEAALEKLEVAPRAAVVIGDTPYDAEAAGHAKVTCIGLLCGGFAEQELRDAGCREIYRDPENLLRNFDRSALARA